ncbi:MAG: hypothetical protein AAGF12_32850 [Myxococcota bacterium]
MASRVKKIETLQGLDVRDAAVPSVVEASLGDDPELGLLALTVGIRHTEFRRRSTPALVDKFAVRLGAAASRLIDGLPQTGRLDPEVGGRLFAARGNALRLAGPDHDAEATAAFEAALGLDRRRGRWWFDLGLHHKALARFEEALEATKQARVTMPEDRGVLWNIAIAATALGHGEEALEAWTALGVPIVSSPGGLPMTPSPMPAARLRVLTIGSGHADPTTDALVPDEAAGFEVLSVQPISPCHGVVSSPSFRRAAVDYGDVVLFDGDPVAITTIDGQRVPTFPLLARLHEGDERRLRFLALEQNTGDLVALGESLPEGARLFVQLEHVESVCSRCASGEVLTKHEHTPPEEHRLVYGKIIVEAQVDLSAVESTIASAVRSTGRLQLSVPELYEALGDSRRAGQEHQAWRGLERVALRRQG